MNTDALTLAFEQQFSEAPLATIHAPGRVNLIGEHTDYNQGFVFPVAINVGTWIAMSPRDDNQVQVLACDYDNAVDSFSIDSIEHSQTHPWSNYVRGVVKSLAELFPALQGANLAVTGNVPQGAGLSSSASFEVAIVRAFTTLYDLPIDGIEAALLGQRAENTFVGCNCGIMDQLISAMGKKDHAMLLDCQSLEIQHATLPEDMEIVIINSNVKRGLVDSEYNLRRQQCEEAAAAMGVDSLRAATLALLAASQDKMSEVVYRRARHIITENQRTLDFYKALEVNDITSLSKLMAASHVSMRDDFEITHPAIDTLVEIVDDVICDHGGVRMTGGGFGGCVVALVPKSFVLDVTQALDTLYHARTGLKHTIYKCSAQQGAFAA